jgi:hypothetical protein
MLGSLKATSSVAVVFVLPAASVGGFAAEDDVPGDYLKIGYEDEGNVDASPEACLASVKEETEGWSQKDLKEAAQKVCASRKRHVEAYGALQNNYRTLMKLARKDVRLSPADAAANLKVMVKACMDHKTALTSGGHNIMVEVIQNDIDAKCLAMAENLLRDEIRELR